MNCEKIIKINIIIIVVFARVVALNFLETSKYMCNLARIKHNILAVCVKSTVGGCGLLLAFAVALLFEAEWWIKELIAGVWDPC